MSTKNFIHGFSPLLFSVVGIQNAALASEHVRYLKFMDDARLSSFLQNNPTAKRVHSSLMWIEIAEPQLVQFSNLELRSLGVLTSESDRVVYRIPRPQRETNLMGNVPNGKLWGISKINSPSAWKVTQGSRDVIVAVVDTGLDFQHPAIKNNIWVNEKELNGRPGVDDDGNGIVDDVYGADFISGQSTPLDDDGHGSHVAGTIAGDSPSENFFGVAPQVRVMAVKTHNDKGEGSKSSVVKGILYAADNGARVLNCSWGGAPEAGEFDQLLFDAIEYANKKGAVLVAAAGNDAANNDTGAHYPSNYDLPGIISVASSTNTDGRSYFSNFGAKTVDLAAPGSNIWSVARGGKGYTYLSGTSMASPHVSGAAALLASTPEGQKMTAAELRDALMQNVQKLSDWSNQVISGGRLDLSFMTRK